MLCFSLICEVVTGATDGIGKEYAKAFAQKGFNVLLISRTENKLKETADEISRIMLCSF